MTDRLKCEAATLAEITNDARRLLLNMDRLAPNIIAEIKLTTPGTEDSAQVFLATMHSNLSAIIKIAPITS